MKIRIIAVVVTAVVIIGGLGAWLLAGNDNNSSNKDGQATQQNQKAKLSVSLDVPQDSLLLSQEKKSLQIAIKASDYSRISRVEYLVDGAFTVYSTRSPFTVDIDLSKLTAGSHTLQALAYDMSGGVTKSNVFTFTIIENQPAQPADDTAKAIVRNSSSIGSLNKSIAASSSSGSSNNSGGDTGGGNPDPVDTTPWPDAPIAQICGNTSLLSGPASAPAGAIVLPAGDNSGISFAANNVTYWFAPGTHYLAQDQFGQIAPGNNTTFVGGPGAILDGNGINNYAFTQHGTNVKIQYLTIKNFVSPRDQGVVNHDSGVGWTMEYNTVQNNGGGGVFAGTNNIVRYNCLKDNGQYGFQVYSGDVGGPTNVLLDHNEIVGNNTDDWEAQINGCGCTGGGKFWEAHNVTVSNNYVHDNLSVGLWADTNDTDFLVEGNYISGNKSQGLFYEISYNMIVRNNNFVRNALVDGPGNPGFPTGAIYLSESGGDSRVAGRTDKIDIYDNKFTDNWAGVILWENADRYCHSPANTSSGTCTMVNPAANLTTCNDPALGGSINVEPYKSDCRWKTQNVKVHNNVFDITKSNISGCSTNTACGFQGLFSNVGTFPSWSPYMGSGIQQQITFNQNNLYSNNTYTGDWNFKAKTMDSIYNFAIWQAAPYNQDTGSTFNGQDHLVITNAIDADTATLEGSIGKWTSWFSATPTRSTAEAHTGTHSLKVDITAPFGWGVQLTNTSGFPVTPLPKTVSYWAKLGAGTGLGVMMRVQWLDADGNLLGSNHDVPLVPLTGSWQQVSVPLTPPAGVATVNIALFNTTGAGGSAGNSLYLDDFVIGDN